MKQDDEILESLIAGGIIGAALGALLSNNKDNGATLGAIAGAALLATYKANEIARKSNVSVLVEEQGSIYSIEPGGAKRFVKKIKKSTTSIPEHFKLK